MDIKELRRQLEKSQAEVNRLRNKKILNFERTQPGSFHFKEIMTSGSPVVNDTFLLYAIKDEELDRPYEIAIEQYKNDLEAYNEAVRYLAKYDDCVLMEFLKNDQNWKWEEIDKFLHYSPDYSRHKLTNYEKKRKAL